MFEATPAFVGRVVGLFGLGPVDIFLGLYLCLEGLAATYSPTP